jgi:simple sugar transport system ATP-binding protein
VGETVLQMQGITKYFGSMAANHEVDFSLEKGKVHGLLGENGAGKTTLMNILFGLHKPDSGSIILDGKEVAIHSPAEAMSLGIGMVHQHFMLVPTMTVTENVMLGLRLPRYPLINPAIAKRRIEELSTQFALNVDPQALISQLSVGQQQRVEIITALYNQTRILILDEPTAVLTPDEARELFEILRVLKAHGTSVILISHKLDEIISIADDVTILRNGELVCNAKIDIHTTRKEDLSAMMVGRNIDFNFAKQATGEGRTLLSVQHLSAYNDRGVHAVNDLTFTVRKGEILAIAGVDGNGQKELCEVLTGLRKSSSGSVMLDDQDITDAGPAEIIEKQVAYVPEDRQRTGLIMNWDVSQNIVLKSFHKKPYTKGLFLSPKAMTQTAEKAITDFTIKTESSSCIVKNLSGGNQQKVILARELTENPALLIVSHPTRGLDVGAMEYVRSLLISKRNAGVAILLISADLDEVFQTADRILVMYNGRAMGVVEPTVDIQTIGHMMAGVVQGASHE